MTGAEKNGEGPEWMEAGLDAAPDGGTEKLDTDLGNVFQDDNQRPPDETAPATTTSARAPCSVPRTSSRPCASVPACRQWHCWLG